MTATGWVQIGALVAVLTASTPLLGGYMARVFGGERVAVSGVLGPVERTVYSVLRVDSGEGQGWKEYARAVLLFSAASWLLLYLILRTQGIQPLNPEGFHSGPWDLSFNTASSFVSNTSWQYYAGETTLSYFSQMTAITVASFTSCATGMAVAAAMIRGLAARGTDRLGNFWVDATRSLLYVLLPVAALAAIFLVASGVPPDPLALPERTRPDGPVPVDRGRPGRLARGDQADVGGRRGILQHEFGAPVREPHGPFQLR
jgi:K+-transporting ATPase ATPase A chain